MLNSTVCDDTDACTELDVCTNGVCAGARLDADNDGEISDACGGGDCNDGDPKIGPQIVEGPFYGPLCSDTIDNDCDTLIDGADDNCVDQSTLLASASVAPADGTTAVIVTAVPRDALGVPLGVGLTVEIRADMLATVTGTGACGVPAVSCATAIDAGGGSYTVTATSVTVGNVQFSAVIVGTPDLPILQTATVNFDASSFVVITTDTTITSADAGT
ncbi:MAG: hypothetical protein V3T05_12195, partial [Myxococcota bacterium]